MNVVLFVYFFVSLDCSYLSASHRKPARLDLKKLVGDRDEEHSEELDQWRPRFRFHEEIRGRSVLCDGSVHSPDQVVQAS